MKEYDKFAKGAANSNTSTKVLQKQLEDPTAKIIITTIQKLDVNITKNKGHEIFGGHIVLIFDECHRSQFGDMHAKIVKAFKKYHIFGFTGTPIFAVNAGSGGNPLLKTTEQAFGDKLHTYTIVDAINDENVLPFRIDYVDTVKAPENLIDKQVRAIDVEKALSAPKRISIVVDYILEHFDQKTKRSKFFTFKRLGNISEVIAAPKQTKVEETHEIVRLSGFNSILAVGSIPMAKKYYLELKKQIEERHAGLTIATIFSFSANEDDPEDVLGNEGFDTEGLDKTSRDFLGSAIEDYNRAFGTNYDTSSDKFQNYYKDVSLRMKNREIDILIVVNMFLTGFDATTLNTLWVDKNLRRHGLIQSFSRTNRILNSVKTYGNIICFRDLTKETDDAIALFGDKDAGGIVLLKSYADYMNGYEEDGEHKKGYVELVDEITEQFPIGSDILGETDEKFFIKLYGAILRYKNILDAFDDFAGNEILTPRDFQDYQSVYIDLYQKYCNKTDADKEDINDDIIFEIELVKQIEVNIDYILMLVAKYHDSNCTDKSILLAINKAVSSSIELRSKKELIEQFVASINADSEVDDDWRKFVLAKREQDIALIISEESLKDDEARRFIANAFRDGALKTTGTDIDKILPPVSRFGGGGSGRAVKKQSVIEKLLAFFEKYFGLV
jgi:type I restriction enzyme R subunit